EDAADSGALQESEREIVGNALNFAETLVRQVMVPRTELVAVPEEASRAALVALGREHPFSRYPVYRRDLDNVVGVLHLRDLLLHDGKAATAGELMRPALLLPETLHLDAALAALRKRHASLAIALDEFGGTAGLITLRDMMAEIVGEVHDEFESNPAEPIRQEAPDRYLVKGLTTLEELREATGFDVHDEESDTVGGMVFGRLGRVPVVGDKVHVDGWAFEVTSLDGRRVAQVRAERIPPPAEAEIAPA